MDLPNIEVVVQWKASNLDLNTLVQRFGRGGRNLQKQALCLLLVEPDFTDKERRNKAEKAEKAAAKRITNAVKNTAGKRVRPMSPDTRRVRARNADDSNASNSAMEIEIELANETSQSPGIQATKTTTHRKALMTRAERIQLNLDPDIDSFINAGEQGREQCRREPIARIYGNDKLCG